MQIDPDDLRERAADGRLKSLKGIGSRSHEVISQALAGAVLLRPMMPLKNVSPPDLVVYLQAPAAVLAALLHRERTGEGQYIDMALLDVQVSSLANQGLNYLTTGVPPARLGNAHPNIVPYDVFPVADGHIIIATGARARELPGAARRSAPDFR